MSPELSGDELELVAYELHRADGVELLRVG
jgi:hypothetical protein